MNLRTYLANTVHYVHTSKLCGIWHSIGGK